MSNTHVAPRDIETIDNRSDQEPTPAPELETQKRPSSEPTLETKPKLRGVEPQERLPNAKSEEDLLEIPAFLRRQAN
jgi:cell division protein FtsZ